VYCQKLLILPKVFKTSKISLCRLSKVASYSSATNLMVLKTSEIGPGRFSKAFGVSPRNMLPNSGEGFELVSFEKLSANSKAFGAKRLRA
jgi:hypothetical protein